ncbi:DUF4442 domain-containing protein [Psychroflexus sp. ALD_RP9]|uniref:DUF4442 domain-containing protein n=1 Tax=Psychroflexus sp. ALD_RP9 TaxID=2777186 RepID=UPI001A8CCB23|nr:DUF4442 domain-containing protein [Psychroflexus sp. ALD_RP9]QSS97366.1 DUF4442 domain-containing protein [Psychroflexus sp. ALD_RP9]
MKFTVQNINRFLFLKLPIAWIAGVRLTKLAPEATEAKARLKWLSQNPFNSMYFAVQAMAAELTTGVLVMREINESHQSVSMLVAENSAIFHKKARGKITFTCVDAKLVKTTVNNAILTKKGQTVWLNSKAFDQERNCVSEFQFKWTLKLKS